MRARFVARVEKGSVIFVDPARWRGVVARHEGKRIAVTVEREQTTRSLKANAYLWGVVYRTIAEWSGHTEDEIHEAMKEKFLVRRELVFPSGEEMPVVGSTAILDTVDFSTYVMNVKAWAAGCGVLIPEPGEIEVAL